MLDFSKAQNIASEMMGASKKYTERFLQVILNNFFFDDYEFVETSLEFEGCYRSPDYFSTDPDPLGIFTSDDIIFTVIMTCFGEISISFDTDVNITSNPFHLLADCLEENGFIKDEEEKRFAKYVRRAQ